MTSRRSKRDVVSGDITVLVRRTRASRTFWLLLGMVSVSGAAGLGQEWSRFRGPNGSGVSDTGTALPVQFGPDQNLLWRHPVGSGHSSPVLCDGRIFLTSNTEESFEVLCLDSNNGRLIWRRQIPQTVKERVHRINTRATPTAVVDANRVYVYFGTFGIACFDHDGREQWRRPLKQPLRNLFGTASSLMLTDEAVIFTCDNEVSSFVEALRPATGDRLWHKSRNGFRSSWSTPIVLENNGSSELIIYGVSWLSALDPKDGSDLWAVPGLADEPAITPVIGGGLVFASSYNMKSSTESLGIPPFTDILKQLDQDNDGAVSFQEGMANKSVLSRHDADGEGDHPLRLFYRMLDENQDKQISKTEYAKLQQWLNGFEQENGLVAIRPPAQPGEKAEIVWRHRTGVPEIPSPLFYRGRIYLVKNGGIATCLNAKTGKQIYQKRLNSGGPYYASPVVANGHIYATSARGVVTVFEAGDELKILARNKMGERIMATPAIVGDSIYIRTESKLLAFGLNSNEKK